jgi:hypothetical protein
VLNAANATEIANQRSFMGISFVRGILFVTLYAQSETPDPQFFLPVRRACDRSGYPGIWPSESVWIAWSG